MSVQPVDSMLCAYCFVACSSLFVDFCFLFIFITISKNKQKTYLLFVSSKLQRICVHRFSGALFPTVNHYPIPEVTVLNSLISLTLSSHDRLFLSVIHEILWLCFGIFNLFIHYDMVLIGGSLHEPQELKIGDAEDFEVFSSPIYTFSLSKVLNMGLKRFNSRYNF